MLAVRCQLRAMCGSSFTQALQNLPFCTARQPFLSGTCTSSQDSQHSFCEHVVALLSTIDGPALGIVLEQLALAETVALPQTLMKAALLAHCPSGHLIISAYSPPQQSPWSPESPRAACTQESNRSMLLTAYLPLLPDLALQALNLSNSYFHPANTDYVVQMLAQLSSLTKLDISNTDVPMLQAAEIVAAPSGLQHLAMRSLQLQNRYAETSSSQLQQLALVSSFRFSSATRWGSLCILDMQGCSVMRSDYCSLLQALSALSSLTSLDLSDLDIHPKNNRLQQVKASNGRISLDLLGSTNSGDATHCSESSLGAHVHLPVEDWEACATVVQALPLHKFELLGLHIEPAADTLCRALVAALTAVATCGDKCTQLPSASSSFDASSTQSAGSINRKGSPNEMQVELESLIVTNTADPGGWGDDNSSQVRRSTATELFAVQSRIPSLTTVKLMGMPIGYPPLRSSRAGRSNNGTLGANNLAVHGASSTQEGAAAPTESRQSMREDMYALVADMAAPDQHRNTVVPPGLMLPFRCLEVNGLSFGVRSIYDPRSAAYECSGDRIAMYSWSSLRGLTRLSLTSVQLFRHGHAAELSRGLESLTALRSLCVARYAGAHPLPSPVQELSWLMHCVWASCFLLLECMLACSVRVITKH